MKEKEIDKKLDHQGDFLFFSAGDANITRYVAFYRSDLLSSLPSLDKLKCETRYLVDHFMIRFVFFFTHLAEKKGNIT